MFMARDYVYGTRDWLDDMTCMLWRVLHGQWTRMARARVRLPSDGYDRGTGTVRPRRKLCVVFMVHNIRTDCDRPVLW
ncbi:hypothetical protein M6B38_368095 [Iris pallida]|uniref:Uncharacterized protein n=1 Tax=Iris pallida TaxID=29817 RepID=A0AAX6GF49_IRIPA|nr:hypothetical protein M6B38_106495 [Iris pallida]KAJ6827192.1 hypothetical protein M6B38_368095 [Iris pallida]